MKKLIKVLLAVTTLISISGCGKMHNPEVEIYKLNEQKLDELMTDQSVSCDNLSQPCPAGVARIFMINKNYTGDSGLCSGFMIAPDVLVTNAHCMRTNQRCRQAHISIYDESGNLHNRKCASILYRYEEDGGRKEFQFKTKIDIAIIKLDRNYLGKYPKVKRTTKQQLKEGQKINAWVIDHSGMASDDKNVNPLDFRITELNCYVSNEKGPKSIMLNNCPSIGGNSGSMVMDENNNVIGVLWGGNYEGDANTAMYSRRNSDAFSLITPSKYFSDYAK